MAINTGGAIRKARGELTTRKSRCRAVAMDPEEKEMIWKHIKAKLGFLIKEEKINEVRREAEEEWAAELRRREKKTKRKSP
jgi:hypothetical protein